LLNKIKWGCRKSHDLVEVVGQLWQQVWAADLQRSYSYDFEAYQMGETGPEDTLVEIFISLTN
jgi:predicted transcriptional regulator YdeE